MKVAEIFAELGIKLTGSSKTDLDGFEQQLINIANAAKQAAAALVALSKAQVPKGLTVAATKQQNAPPATAVAMTPGTPAAASPTQPGNPPALPGNKPLPNSVMQGLKSLGMLGLKVLGIGTIVLALKSLISALGRWLKASVAATVSTELFTRQTGTNRKTLKEWELASTKAGLAEGEAANAFKMLAQKRQQILATGEGATPFGQLRINAMAKPEEVFRQFQERTRNFTQEQAVFWGSLLGFSEDFSAWLHSFQGDIERLPEGALLSDKEQKAVVSLNASWVDLTTALERLRDKVVADVAPAFQGLLDILIGVANVLTLFKPLREAFVGNPFGAAQSLTSPPRGGGGQTVNNTLEVTLNGLRDPATVQKALEGQSEKFFNRMTGRAYYQTPPSNLAPQPQ